MSSISGPSSSKFCSWFYQVLRALWSFCLMMKGPRPSCFTYLSTGDREGDPLTKVNSSYAEPEHISQTGIKAPNLMAGFPRSICLIYWYDRQPAAISMKSTGMSHGSTTNCAAITIISVRTVFWWRMVQHIRKWATKSSSKQKLHKNFLPNT